MPANIVDAKLTADTGGAVKNVDNLADSFDEAAGSAKKAGKEVESFEDRMGRIGGKLTGVGAALSVGLTAPIVGVAGAAINMGMEAVEAESLFETSFGNMADEVRAWSMETSDALGLNEFELRRQSATMFTMTQSMGVSGDAAKEMAKDITVLAGDMASFFNSSPEEAFNKLRSGITGEAEPLKQLGILVTENFIKQTEFAKAILATGREMTEQEKVTARWHAILKQTATAQGDLARTAESPANRIRRMGSAMEEASTKLGLALIPALERILPMIEGLVKMVEKTVDAFAKLPAPIQSVIIVLVGLLAAAGPVLVVVGQLVTALGTVSAAWAASSLAGAGFVGGLTVIGSTLATFITGTLLPVLGALAVGVALGGAVGIAVSEFLEWLGVIESVEEKTRKLVEATGPSVQDIKLMGEASVISGREIEDWGEAVKIVNENNAKLRSGTEGYVNAIEKVAAETDAATKATEELQAKEEAAAAATAAAAEASKKAAAARKAEAAATTRLADSLGTTGLVKSAVSMSKALEELNQRGEELSEKGLNQVLKKIQELKAEGIALEPALEAINQKFVEMGQRSAEVIANMDFEPPALSAKELDDSMAAATEQFGKLTDEVPGIDGVTEAMGGLSDRTFDLDSAMGQVNDLLSEARGFMNLFGIEGDSALGKIVEGATKVFDTFNSILSMSDKSLGFFGKLFGGGGGGGGG